ncbi:hypothetical protein [Bradyrhizobium viridifuturi]|uniref:hypothetical protein n=1 Tax=Bradyrhizobium viridifuturi TaxID=1654716 RepID=UPI00067EA802|nr:hypothetical protein [Bradyrhizobium viridifuturi]
MHLRRLANLWILLLVAAGLLLAPVATAFARMMPDASAATMQAMPDHQAMGMAMSHHAMSDQAMSDQAMPDEAMSGQAMADNMPCCPDQTKSKGCDDCPFLALCMLSVSLAAPAGAASLVKRDPLPSRIAARDDRLLDGLAAKPPDHPPRTNV